MYADFLVLLGKVDLPLDHPDEFLDVSEEFGPFPGRRRGICHVDASEQAGDGVEDIVAGDVVHQVQFLVGKLDRFLCPPPFGNVPEHAVHSLLFPVLVKLQEALLLNPVNVPPFVRQPECCRKLGMFAEFPGKIFNDTRPVFRMEEIEQQVADDLF